MAITKILYRNGGLRQAIDYITNPVKTDENLLTDYVRCDPGHAAQQMMDTKPLARPPDGSAITSSSLSSRTRSRRSWHMRSPDSSQPSICRDTKPSLRPMWTKHIFTRILCSTRSMPSLGKCITAPVRITTGRFAAFQIGCAKHMV